MFFSYKKQHIVKQLITCNLIIILIAAISFLFVDLIGYRSVALLLLATVSILSIFYSLYPILVAATMSALIWDFFFIPPHFTFHIDSSENALLLVMYFVIAIVNGTLSSKIREFEKIEQQKENNENAIKLYKTLFDSLSHELRTPIATIVGASDNLLDKNIHISEPNKIKLIEEISVASFRLNRLIDNLLNMQRIESGSIKVQTDWCEINELISTPINRLRDELSSHSVIVQIPDNFPIIKLDFGLMEQAIFNILHNETIYTKTNSEITIQASYYNNNFILSISDNGKGFTEDELKFIFTKFYRSKSKTTGGIGLGLSIVKGFIEAHRGNIRIENNIPHGAKFIIEIPSEKLELNDILDFPAFTLKKNTPHSLKSETEIEN